MDATAFLTANCIRSPPFNPAGSPCREVISNWRCAPRFERLYDLQLPLYTRFFL
jgi:hypothetical protein